MGKKRNERGAASREMELAPTREHRTNSQSHSGKLPYVTVRDSQQRVTSKEAPLDCRGTQMLSPKCASRRSAVSKIHQDTVCVPVTDQTLPRAGGNK